MSLRMRMKNQNGEDPPRGAERAKGYFPGIGRSGGGGGGWRQSRVGK